MGEGLFSPWHIAIIAFVVFMVFGPKKIADRLTDLSQGVQQWIDDDGEGGSPSAATGDTEAAPAPAAPKKVKLSRRIGQRLYRLTHRRRKRRAPL